MAARGTGSRRTELEGVDLEDRDPRRRIKKAERARLWRFFQYRLGRVGRLIRGLVVLVILAVLAGVAGVVALFFYYGSDPSLPPLRQIGDYRPKQMVRVLDRNDKALGEIGSQRRTVVPYAEIPQVLVQAVVAAEDADFFRHRGIDYQGLVRATIENVLRREYAQGASTITQQVIKQMLLTPEKTLRRKVQEIILARRLTHQLSKQNVLEIYLNHMYFGHGRYGCEEAARFYFGKAVSAIGLGEAALLAGVLQSPERLSPRKHREAAKTRQRYVLGQMAHYKYIDRRTAERVAAEPIFLAPEPASRTSAAPEAVDMVYRQLVAKFGAEAVAQLGGTARTTIDHDLQQQARQAIERGLEELDARQGYRGPSGHLAGKALAKRRADLAGRGGRLAEGQIVEGIVDAVERDRARSGAGRLLVDVAGRQGVVDLGAETRYAHGPKPLADRFKPGDLVRVRRAPERDSGDPKLWPLALELGPQAAMVVMNPQTRELLALVGGYGYRAGGFDRAQRARRQPGSAFKPFVYAAAIDGGRYTAASIVNDAPDVYDLWKPDNYQDEAFRGPVRLRTALADSINTVAIKLLADIGLPLVRDLAVRTGISSPLPDSAGLSAALGTTSVTPLELANAFATFAAEGQRSDPVILTLVGEENVTPPTPAVALRPEVAYILVSMMKSVAEEGTGRAAGFRLRRPVAGKTGTSNASRDAWFVGFTPDLLAAVWVGFDDGKSLGRGETGGRTALPIWLELMARALADRPVRDFVQPPGVVITAIDPATGLLAAPGMQGLPEAFVDGTAPRQVAPAAGEEQSPDKLLLDSGSVSPVPEWP